MIVHIIFYQYYKITANSWIFNKGHKLLIYFCLKVGEVIEYMGGDLMKSKQSVKSKKVAKKP